MSPLPPITTIFIFFLLNGVRDGCASAPNPCAKTCRELLGSELGSVRRRLTRLTLVWRPQLIRLPQRARTAVRLPTLDGTNGLHHQLPQPASVHVKNKAAHWNIFRNPGMRPKAVYS